MPAVLFSEVQRGQLFSDFKNSSIHTLITKQEAITLSVLKL